MFEAFRCVKPRLSGKPQAAATPAGQPAPSADSSRRKQPKHKLTAAAAPGPQQQQPAGGLPEKLGDQPLRLIIVGHNPSDVAWAQGHYYANPTNWMWRILKEVGIAPEAIRGAEDDGKMPELAGVGFTDVGQGSPGTQSAQFTAQHFDAWREPFFDRLRAQLQRACAALGCRCGRCGAPAVVAFAGKRQFQQLFQGVSKAASKGRVASKKAGLSKPGGEEAPQQQQQQRAQQQAPEAVPSGSAQAASAINAASAAEAANTSQEATACSPTPSAARAGALAAAQEQPGVCYQQRAPASVATGRQWVLPQGWPLPASTEVWVMPSTSGAAAMTKEQRVGPWRELAERLQRELWPREPGLLCQGPGASSGSAS